MCCLLGYILEYQNLFLPADVFSFISVVSEINLKKKSKLYNSCPTGRVKVIFCCGKSQKNALCRDRNKTVKWTKEGTAK